MFELASRLKLRFETPRGDVTVEDLWDLPLTSSTNRPNLDDVARTCDRDLREATATVSFVEPAESRNTELQLKLDVVKHVIKVRQDENKAKLDSENRKAMKQKILEVVAEKEIGALKDKSVEELKALAESM